MTEIETWREKKLKDQGETPLSEMPKLTVTMIYTKIQDLEGEVSKVNGHSSKTLLAQNCLT